MSAVKRHIRFNKKNLSRVINKWEYEQGVIKDKVNSLNSVLSSTIYVRSSGSNGTFNVAEMKEEKMLNALVDDFDGNTVDVDQYQFVAIYTEYDPDTFKVEKTYVYPNCIAYKTGSTEPDEKKNIRYINYSWESEDTWIFIKGNYIYVDEFVATEEKTYTLSKAINTESKKPILTVIVNHETLSDLEYSFEKDAETDSYSLILKDDVDVEAGTKIEVVYETDSTVML